MRTIETNARVTEDGELTIHVPPDVPPGVHRVKLVVEDPLDTGKPKPSEFLVIHIDSWPEGLSLRREDMYGDDGR
jgi:hypothetical protein